MGFAMGSCCCDSGCDVCQDRYRAEMTVTLSGWTNNSLDCANCETINDDWTATVPRCVAPQLTYYTLPGGFGFPNLCGGFVILQIYVVIEYNAAADVGSLTVYVLRTPGNFSRIIATYYYEQSGRLDCASISALSVPLLSKDSTYCDAGSDAAIVSAAGALV